MLSRPRSSKSAIDSNEEKARAEPSPVAAYIGELTQELAVLARTNGCATLAYMLEIAAMEAEMLSGLPEGQRAS